MNIALRWRDRLRSAVAHYRDPVVRAARLATKGHHAEAFRLYAQAAAADHRDAQFQVGCAYLEARGVPHSRKEGLRWLERAGAGGHGEACLLLAVALLPQDIADSARPVVAHAVGGLFQSEMTAPTHDEALRWARRAGELGSAEGHAIAGYILTSGPMTLRDPDEAHRRYMLAANGGSANGMFGFALSLQSRSNSEESQQQVMTLIRAAAERGHIGASYTLGHCFLHGIGVARCAEQAVHWLGQAAAGGDSNAQADLATLVMSAGLPETRARVRAWFGQAAEAGDAVAQMNYGICLAEGLGGARDDAEALRWFRRAADRIANAQYWYGRMLVEGRGIAPDPTTGRWWIARAAENGFPQVQTNASPGCASAA